EVDHARSASRPVAGGLPQQRGRLHAETGRAGAATGGIRGKTAGTLLAVTGIQAEAAQPIMKKVTVRAPVRADLAGGTLDLWPLYLFHPGSRTVNVAISFYAESEVCELGDKAAIEIHLTDEQYEQRYDSLQQLAADPRAALI